MSPSPSNHEPNTAHLKQLAKDRARKAKARRRAGMVPQKERTVTRRMGEIAADAGVSVATLYRHRKAGTLDAFLYDPDSLRKIYPGPSDDHQDTSFTLSACPPNADTSFSRISAGISEKDRAAFRSIVEKNLSAAAACLEEWADLQESWPW